MLVLLWQRQYVMISSVANLANLSDKSALQIINLAIAKMKAQEEENEILEDSNIYTYSNPDLAYFAWLALMEDKKGDHTLDLYSKSTLLGRALKQTNTPRISTLIPAPITPSIPYLPRNLDASPDYYTSDGNVNQAEEKGGIFNQFM